MGLAFSVLVMGYLGPSWGVRDDLAALIVVAAVPVFNRLCRLGPGIAK